MVRLAAPPNAIEVGLGHPARECTTGNFRGKLHQRGRYSFNPVTGRAGGFVVTPLQDRVQRTCNVPYARRSSASWPLIFFTCTLASASLSPAAAFSTDVPYRWLKTR